MSFLNPTYCSDCNDFVDDAIFTENGVCLVCKAYYDIRIDATKFVNETLSYRTQCLDGVKDAKAWYGNRDKRIARVQTLAGRAIYYCDPEMDVAPRLIFPSYVPKTPCRVYSIDYIGLERIVGIELQFQATLVAALSGKLDTSQWQDEEIVHWNSQKEFIAHGIKV